jgi:hypothetical protein
VPVREETLHLLLPIAAKFSNIAALRDDIIPYTFENRLAL